MACAQTPARTLRRRRIRFSLYAKMSTTARCLAVCLVMCVAGILYSMPRKHSLMTSHSPGTANSSRLMNARERFWLWDRYQNPDIGDDAPTSGDRYLIYRCDQGSMRACGGWNNRISGALFAYIMANITRRKFRFEHMKPECDITKYIVPNKVDWHLKKSFHQSVDNSGSVSMKRVVDQMHIVRTAVLGNYSDFLGRENVDKPFYYFVGNLFYELGYQCSRVHYETLKWMKNLTAGEIRAALFKRLFKLSGYLRGRLDDILSKNLPTEKHKLICAHMRIGVNPSNPYDSETRQNDSNVPKMWEFLAGRSRDSWQKVFVASDADHVVQAARSQTFGGRLVSVDGPVLHVDRTRNVNASEKCAGMERLILEEHLLMTCDELVVSHSGIGHLAAHVRGTDQGLFCWYSSGHVGPCKRKDLMKIFFDYVYKPFTSGNCTKIYDNMIHHNKKKRR